MAVTIKNVAVVGATGKIGRPIVARLLATKLFNVTVLTRDTTGRSFPADVGILTHLNETANRPVRISSVNTTQNKFMSMARELGAPDGWNITYSKTEEQEVEARRRWAKGDRSDEVIAMFINRAFIGEGWGGYFPVLDNELLGLKGLTKDELKDMIQLAMAR